MDVWEIVLYGSAAYLTLQLLVRLMDAHRRNRLAELATEFQRQQKDAAKRQAAANATIPADERPAATRRAA